MQTETPGGAPPRGELFKESYFPTFIYYQDLPDSETLNETIKPHLYAWRSQDQQGIVRSNVQQVGSWHSKLDMHQREEYHALTRQIVAAVRHIYDDLGYDPAYEPLCDNMWANINPRYGYNRNHTHPGVLWSGVYYVQAPSGSGRIFFSDPRPQVQVLRPWFDPDKLRGSYNWTEVYFQPIEGRVILFPAWLVHEVEPNMSDAEGPEGDRISVAFNFRQRLSQRT